MKPNFALGLTKDGITLWQRGASGWLRVGAVSPDAPEMDAQMRDLAKVAASLAPDGICTKLVVPDDQILFCDLNVSARNPEMQAHEIRAQMAGRTPYPVEELDFDWTISGDIAHVAVVARETVIEAEDFASQFGLNPVSVVGACESGRFTKEPFFGTTRGARDILGDPALLERDNALVHETGLAVLPDPELVVKTSDTPPEQPGKEAAAGDSEAADATGKTPDAAPASAPTKTPPVDAPPKSNRPAVARDTQEQVPGNSAAPSPAKSDDAKSAPRPSASGPAPVTPAMPVTDSTDSDSDSAMVAFRSRRATASPAVAAPAASGPKPVAKGGKDLLGSLRTKLGSGQSLSKRAFGSLGKSLGTPKQGAQKSSVETTPTATTPKPTALGSPASKDLQQKSKAANGKRATARTPSKGATSSARTVKEMLPQRKDALDTLTARANSGGGQSEVERMTIFGARNRDEPEPTPGRRALLVLGGVGLLLLAVAIWVFYFTSSEPDIVPEVADDFNPVLEPVPLESDLADLREDSGAQDDIEAALGIEDAAQQVPIDAAEPQRAQDARTNPQPEPPTSGGDVNAGRIAGLRSSSLLPPQEAVPLPAAPDAPAPFGSDPLPPLREEVETAADSAADPPEVETGDIVAEDTTAPVPSLPEGEDALEITVTDGTPPVTPPARPEGLAPELETVATPDPEPETPAQDDPQTTEAPGLAPDILDESSVVIDVTEGRPAVSPPVRPDGLAPELPDPPAAEEPEPQVDPATESLDESSSADQASLDTPPPGGVALTALRPAARPDELEEATLSATVEPEINASNLAVAASLRPGARPGQFATVVQRALRAAQQRNATQTPDAVASAPEPQAAVQTARAAVPAAPPIPASASVAREATQARSINLRQINLIGVMGTSSSRRALVRLSNGRVVTVRIGESLDGGRVTAIGETELRYTRRGRDVVLRIAS